MANYIRQPNELSCQLRLDEDLEVQATFRHLGRCGAYMTALAFACLLDRLDISNRAFDLLADWRGGDPKTCWEFDPPPIRFGRKRGPVDYLRLVPPTEPEA